MKRDTQPSLFGPPNQYGGLTPLARATDPDTSHEAAERHERSGAVEGNAAIVLAILKRIGKSATFREVYAATTDDERAELGESGAVEVQRRLNDLRGRFRLVRNGPTRACSVNGTPMQTWEVI